MTTTLLTLLMAVTGLNTLIIFLFVLAIVGLIIYLIGYIPLGAPWQTIFRVLVIIAVLYWALTYFGVF